MDKQGNLPPPRKAKKKPKNPKKAAENPQRLFQQPLPPINIVLPNGIYLNNTMLDVMGFNSQYYLNNTNILNRNVPVMPVPSTSNNVNVPIANNIVKQQQEPKAKSPKDKKVALTKYAAFKTKKRAGANIWKPPPQVTSYEISDVNIDSDEALIDYNFVFRIYPVKNPQGSFIRKRSTCESINFGQNIPVIQISNFTLKGSIRIRNKCFDDFLNYSFVESLIDNSKNCSSATAGNIQNMNELFDKSLISSSDASASQDRKETVDRSMHCSRDKIQILSKLSDKSLISSLLASTSQTSMETVDQSMNCSSVTDDNIQNMNELFDKSLNLSSVASTSQILDETFCSSTTTADEMNESHGSRKVSNPKSMDLNATATPKKKRSRKKKAASTGDQAVEPKKEKKRKMKEKPLELYPEYMDDNAMEQGLKKGTLVKGFIRVNVRKPNDGYVTNIVEGDTDYCIKASDQNRALEGDEVILEVKPEAECEEGRKMAKVVRIVKKVHPRTCVGTLLPIAKQDLPKAKFALFSPRDHRLPNLLIPVMSWPVGYETDPQKFSKNLFLAKITDWEYRSHAEGLIIENLGMSEDLKVENLAILKMYGLEQKPFDPELLKDLPKLEGLEEKWFEGREDLRNECVFTIDPLTARDLDDAVSCKRMPDGNFEIGVHIADVSHYLKEDSGLDEVVRSKATTVYMVDRAHHMLPLELCMSCSLLPGKDKLAFSVFWRMTPKGEILDTRFAKTVIRSCVQLAYQHAQLVIDDPLTPLDPSVFPDILNGFTADKIKENILILFGLSRILRAKRFENGALRIDQIKMSFVLDPKTGKPVCYYNEWIREANNLIEEFMLLANISVAERLRKDFGSIAFLRSHNPPKETMMKELKIMLESIGVHVDITSSKSIQNSLKKYTSDDPLGKVRGAVLSHLFAKPMTRARYFCPVSMEDDFECHHFALNIPLYTHFTSPIRRYADIMVHRLLSASIGITDRPSWNSEFVSEVAEICNLKKYNSKKAQEDSGKLYLGHYLKKNGPLVKDAAVVDVREKSFDVLVLDCGEIVRIYLGQLQGCDLEVEEIPCVDLDSKDQQVKKYWRQKISYFPTKHLPAVMIMIELFALVRIELKMCNKKRKIEGKLLRPNV